MQGTTVKRKQDSTGYASQSDNNATGRIPSSQKQLGHLRPVSPDARYCREVDGDGFRAAPFHRCGLSSTRRLLALPASVALLSIGLDSP